MAYVVEEADGREFVVPVFGKEIPLSWTRDKEKDAILFCYHKERENRGKQYFFFQYKGYEIDIILDGSEFVDENIKKWRLISIHIPKELSRKEVLIELRQAIEAYGCYGSCFMPTGKAIADF